MLTPKNIAIFGIPGSGKTTITHELVSRLTNVITLEASRSIIAPAASLGFLPKRSTDFIRRVVKAGPMPLLIPREEARSLFPKLSQQYSPDIIARALDSVVSKRKNITHILSGVRGYQNALYLQSRGYIIVYLDISLPEAKKRLQKRDNISSIAAANDIEQEEKLYQTSFIKKLADIIVTGRDLPKDLSDIVRRVASQECTRCINSSINPAITLLESGLCQTCHLYTKHFSKAKLEKEKQRLLTFRGKYGTDGKHDVLVGISGGKDSTATLATVKKLGFSPLAFTLDTGYYPTHIFPRAKQAAEKLRVPHKRIDIRKYARPVDLKCFAKMAELYDEARDPGASHLFRAMYTEGRKHYSAKCKHSLPFVRTCQLCRRVVIRAYYGEAVKRGVQVVVLGMNEWAGLSGNQFTAIRRLKPYKNRPAVYIVHLPFLLQRSVKDTKAILKELGWKVPAGESFVESNANSCLLALAAETDAKRLLGFHPDTTRLAREVTVGFITKGQAKVALQKIHSTPRTVRQTLKHAKLIS